MASLSRALEAPLARLGSAVEWIVKTRKAAPESAAASAVAVLHLTGVTVGYWLILRQLAAANRDEKSGGDARFAQAKRAYAFFYASHILPQTEPLFVSIVGGPEVITSFDPTLMNA